MIWQLIQIFYIISTFTTIDGQTNGVPEFDDPTNQELTLLDWSSGIRVFYCTDAPLEILVEPFKRALIGSLNKFCKNATACRLVKSISFKPDYVVLLDGYPKHHYGAVQFRFVIVLPPNAESLDRLRKPFLTREVLSNFLNTSIKEFERRFGWKVSSYERFPKFDPMTEFMNMALIPIGFILLILMLLLAYWSSTISRSSGSNEAWFIIGTTGGKSKAMKRTLEIIEKQKVLFAEKNHEQESRCGKLPKLSIQSISEISNAEECESNKDIDTSTKETIESKKKPSMELSPLHLSIIRSESTSTMGSTAIFRNVGRRKMSRRLSSIDDGNFIFKRQRKKRNIPRTKRYTHQQFRLTSMALSGFGHFRKS